MTHQIYWWWSEALKQYGHGRLLACATSADEARVLARQAGIDWHKEWREWDHCDPEEVSSFLAKLDSDLAKEPEITSAIGIGGSE